MKEEEFRDLSIGDIVKHKSQYHSYIITTDGHDRKIAVRSVELTNPNEWEVVYKARYSKNDND